ncbi:hypothetical protein N6H14_21685 [Paenibacillus sp. CC-CFT747]|nr:hypothetical protein N6H14_21685 [Paenibacillus sp. CC-CFT747]
MSGTAVGASTAAARRKRLARPNGKYGYYYLMAAPALIGFFLFHYVPMYGVILAFKDYKFALGIIGSPWVGFEHFERFFTDPFFWRILRNTVVISSLHILFGFPAPIVLALLFNELVHKRFKMAMQTISYLPHFMSWVILSGVLIEVLSPSRGAVNYLITLLGEAGLFPRGLPLLCRGADREPRMAKRRMGKRRLFGRHGRYQPGPV